MDENMSKLLTGLVGALQALVGVQAEVRQRLDALEKAAGFEPRDQMKEAVDRMEAWINEFGSAHLPGEDQGAGGRGGL